MSSTRSWLSIPLAFWLAVSIHVDWHLARPHPERLSLAWPLHWLVAVPVFALIAWRIAATRRSTSWLASAATVVIGVGIGQVLVPLGEVLYFGLPLGHIANPLRWSQFAEFLAAGLLTLLVFMPALVYRR